MTEFVVRIAISGLMLVIPVEDGPESFYQMVLPATGHLPEPKNNPQIGMANMRQVMPAVQRAKPVKPSPSGVTFSSVAVPTQQRDTKIVKDMPPEEIAKEIADWIKS